MKKLIFLLSMAAAAAGCGVQAGRTATPEMAAAVAERLESGYYTIYVEVMTPSRGRSITLSHPWNIVVDGETLHSWLPYVGMADMPTMPGPQDGLDFDAPIKDYSIKPGRRGAIEVEFWVMSSEDRYDYSITVYPNGRVYLRVSPDRKSAVTFDGRLSLDGKP